MIVTPFSRPSFVRAALGRLGRGQIGTPAFSEYINWVENARKIYVKIRGKRSNPQAKKAKPCLDYA